MDYDGYALYADGPTCSEYPQTVGTYERWWEVGGVPLYACTEGEPIHIPQSDQSSADEFWLVMAVYLNQYRETRYGWWNREDVPIGTWAPTERGWFVDLPGVYQWNGKGGCADWTGQIRGAYHNYPLKHYWVYQVYTYVLGYTVGHQAACVYAAPALYGRECVTAGKDLGYDYFAVILDPWITGCPCIYSWSGWLDICWSTGACDPPWFDADYASACGREKSQASQD